jgi:hypothetical protein
MGLDSVEIIMDIADHFGIEITDAEAARCGRVGDLLGCKWVTGHGSWIEGVIASAEGATQSGRLDRVSATRLLRRVRWTILAMTHRP